MGIHIMPPLFKLIIEKGYGPEVTVKFYPDKNPESTSVDGYTSATVYTGTWATLHNAPGTAAYPSSVILVLSIICSTTSPIWRTLRRVNILVDTSIIPPGSKLISARLFAYGTTKNKTASWLTQYNVFDSFPATNTDLIASDYPKYDAVPLATAIAYADFKVLDWNIWELNATGLASIVMGSITKLAIRESAFDAPDTSPTWESGKLAEVQMSSADALDATKKPYLEITYRPPL